MFALLLALGARGAMVDEYRSHQRARVEVARRGRRLAGRLVSEATGTLDLDLSVDTSIFADTYREVTYPGLDVRRGIPQCLYSGGARDNSTGLVVGRVRASFCRAERIVVRTRATVFEVRRVEPDGHVVVDHRDHLRPIVGRGVEMPWIPPQQQQRRRRLSSGECADRPRKYAQMLVANDEARYEARGEDTEDESALVMWLVRDIYYADDDAYFGDASEGYGLYDAELFECYVEPVLVGQVTFRNGNPSDIEYVEGESCCGDACSGDEVSTTCLLTSFSEWALSTTREELEAIFGEIDNVQLFSERDFASATVGYAYVSAMCSSQFSAAIDETASSSITYVSTVVAHELGHNLGMSHDELSTDYIMASSSGGNPEGINFQFSDESKDAANTFMDEVYGESFPACLDDEASVLDDATLGACGDGVVDDGEECDPGVYVNDDECCSSECQLVGDCECANTDACCDDGVVSSAGTTCRSARDADCDFAEVCDGESSDCPIDLFVSAGAACGDDDDGECYRGDCISASDDCDWSDDYVYPCPGLSTCTMVYCRSSPSATRCYTQSSVASNGAPCDENGVQGQCIGEIVDFTDDDDDDDDGSPVSATAAACVDSEDIKFYHWTDDCACNDEEGTQVPTSACDISSRCSPTTSPTASLAPTTPRPTASPPTKIPTPGPTGSPEPTTSTPSMRPTVSPMPSTSAPSSPPTIQPYESVKRTKDLKSLRAYAPLAIAVGLVILLVYIIRRFCCGWCCRKQKPYERRTPPAPPDNVSPSARPAVVQMRPMHENKSRRNPPPPPSPPPPPPPQQLITRLSPMHAPKKKPPFPPYSWAEDVDGGVDDDGASSEAGSDYSEASNETLIQPMESIREPPDCLPSRDDL
ncbi:hypothetical protein CTAYLR_003352 [Chrysophaeum taylorii]|uniref:Uncharacterized protein n=1 Tax=Chrysophaeum taylorii TaxID=2483200 RepID=A0AAD7UFE3_9STRA|nr:hypothetical protein CTAYLR_003352 [Chrysophaeum taylorii]